MSYRSLSKDTDGNTFSQQRDEETKKNFKETLDTAPTGNKQKASPSKIDLKPLHQETVHKQSVTFSISPTQLEKLNSYARKNGFKGRSDLLSAIIDSLE